MTFEAIHESMSRKGYRQGWMHELPSCLERTDRKLNGVYRKYKLAKVFEGLQNYLSI